MENPTNRRAYIEWQDVSFTALTGWVTVWKDEVTGVFVEPCPGVLIQEATAVSVSWDDLSTSPPTRRSRIDRIPRETRTVFAYCDGESLHPIEPELGHLLTAPADDSRVHDLVAAEVTE